MTQPPRIVFLADAGPAVGGGHVMRCLTLAEALSGAGARCAFVATPSVSDVLDVFASAAIERWPVAGGSARDLATQGAGVARAWDADAAVIDHYGLDRDQEAIVASAVRRTVVIDDLRRPHACDLVLDSNLGRTGADYPGQAALTGAAFALVRAGFAALRTQTLRRRRARPPVRRIMVSLGLTDVGAITARVVSMLQGLRGDAALDVVLGGAAPSLPALRAMARSGSGITLHVDATDMAGLTASADLAVGAGGSSVWERCCLGLPTVLVVLADNQRPNALELSRAGAVSVAEAGAEDFNGQLGQAVVALAASADDRLRLSEACARLCDGQGADRVATRMLKLIGPRQA